MSHRLSHKTTPQALTKKAGEAGEVWEESLSGRAYFITPGSPSVPGSLWWPFFRDPLSSVGLEQGASYSTERMKSWGNLHVCVLGPEPCSLGWLVSDAFMNKHELELHFHLWAIVKYWLQFSSVQWLSSVESYSLRPHGLQHARLPCPSPTPRVYTNSCPLSRWCHPTISSSVVPFSSLHKSFPASMSFQMSQLFTSSGQSIHVSASMSVLPMNIQLISFRMHWLDLLAVQGTLKSLLQHHSSKASILRCSAFFIVQLSPLNIADHYIVPVTYIMDFPGGSMVKNLPAMQETWVQSLGQEDTLKKEMATHSRILAWEIPRTDKPGGLPSMGWQKN